MKEKKEKKEKEGKEKMEKKRICFIAQFPPPMHGLSKAVETLYSHPFEEFVYEKADITDNKRFLKNLFAISKSKADLFYFTISQTKGGNLRDLVILKLLRLRNKKCLVHLHGGYYRKMVDSELPNWQKKANYRALSQAAGAVVLSDSLKDIFRGMMPEDRIHAVMNCVDDEFLLSDEEAAQKFSAWHDKQVLHVLYLSNFIRTKGYPTVLEWALREKQRTDAGGERRFHFDFAGKFFDEQEQTYFDRFVRDNDLSEFVSYHGVVGGSEKKALLKEGNIFALPTRYPKEGQPISILEAMGNAMMIVTTDHAGIPDIVTDGVNGILLKEDDGIDELYGRLLAMSNEQMASMASKNREVCKRRYSQARYLADMKEVFMHTTSF